MIKRFQGLSLVAVGLTLFAQSTFAGIKEKAAGIYTVDPQCWAMQNEYHKQYFYNNEALDPNTDKGSLVFVYPSAGDSYETLKVLGLSYMFELNITPGKHFEKYSTGKGHRQQTDVVQVGDNFVKNLIVEDNTLLRVFPSSELLKLSNPLSARRVRSLTVNADGTLSLYLPLNQEHIARNGASVQCTLTRKMSEPQDLISIAKRMYHMYEGKMGAGILLAFVKEAMDPKTSEQRKAEIREIETWYSDIVNGRSSYNPNLK